MKTTTEDRSQHLQIIVGFDSILEREDSVDERLERVYLE